jgi:hypothetical protein
MDNNRGREGRSEHNTQERGIKQSQRHGLPNGFEGMNFEQQRGSYKNSDKGGRPDDLSGKERGRKSRE